MRSTGPILAVGAITVANQSILHDQPIDWRVPIATGIAVGIFSLIEHAWPDGAVGLAWLALVTTIFVPLTPGVPPPAQSLAAWWAKP